MNFPYYSIQHIPFCNQNRCTSGSITVFQIQPAIKHQSLVISHLKANKKKKSQKSLLLTHSSGFKWWKQINNAVAKLLMQCKSGFKSDHLLTPAFANNNSFGWDNMNAYAVAPPPTTVHCAIKITFFPSAVEHFHRWMRETTITNHVSKMPARSDIVRISHLHTYNTFGRINMAPRTCIVWWVYGILSVGTQFNSVHHVRVFIIQCILAVMFLLVHR